MPIVLLLKYWKLGLASIAVVLLVIVLSANASLRQTIKQLNTEHELALVKMKADYASKTREIERSNYEQVIQAVNDAKEREQIIIADAANARAATVSLSNTIDQLASTAATDAEFRIKYSNTTGQLLKECSGQYSSMATTADRIANDLRAIQEASRRKQ